MSEKESRTNESKLQNLGGIEERGSASSIPSENFSKVASLQFDSAGDLHRVNGKILAEKFDNPVRSIFQMYGPFGSGIGYQGDEIQVEGWDFPKLTLPPLTFDVEIPTLLDFPIYDFNLPPKDLTPRALHRLPAQPPQQPGSYRQLFWSLHSINPLITESEIRTGASSYPYVSWWATSYEVYPNMGSVPTTSPPSVSWGSWGLQTPIAVPQQSINIGGARKILVWNTGHRVIYSNQVFPVGAIVTPVLGYGSASQVRVKLDVSSLATTFGIQGLWLVVNKKTPISRTSFSGIRPKYQYSTTYQPISFDGSYLTDWLEATANPLGASTVLSDRFRAGLEGSATATQVLRLQERFFIS